MFPEKYKTADAIQTSIPKAIGSALTGKIVIDYFYLIEENMEPIFTCEAIKKCVETLEKKAGERKLYYFRFIGPYYPCDYIEVQCETPYEAWKIATMIWKEYMETKQKGNNK